MTTKPKAKSKAARGKDQTALTVQAKENAERAETFARISMRPITQGALTLADYNKAFGELALDKLISGLAEQCDAVNRGDLKRAESLLTVQAHSLDAIFNNLARRAIKAEYMDNLDRYLRLALKAQSQCRATLETLAAIKNPPVVYARQANIAHGPQQVNNATARSEPRAHARNQETEQSRLLGGETL
ncbi:MAG: hypothetical protein ACRED0_00280 [Gammaproteobacteria bacterium]